MKTPNKERATYKVREAARVAGVGSRSIYKGIAAGTIPHIRFGRNILIPKHAFHQWLDACGDSITGQGSNGDASGKSAQRS